VAILAQFAQQPRRDFRTGSWQRAEQVVIGMLRKELFDLLTIVLQLRLQHPQLFSACHGQTTLGLGQRVRSAKVRRLRENLEPFLVGLRSVEFMGVEKLFPAAFAGADQSLGGGKASTNAQAPGQTQSSKAASAAG